MRVRAFVALVGTGLRLNLRNRMALLYGYLFPLLFLLAFWVIYRSEPVPLLLHMGALLTVTVLGGACFGLPTTMVSERERGVWRRYRLAPVPGSVFVLAVLATRYVLLLGAALLQLAVALAAGMGAPSHPLALLAAFTAAAIAFLGVGLVIAMLADSVPAVQALGQCLFLPMLMIGGVAVPLASLPRWAQTASAFLPGRYAVAAMQACLSGGGLAAAWFALAALLLIGAAAGLAAARMFRWDPRQRLAPGARGRAWLLLALGMWLAVGLAAVGTGRVAAPLAPVAPAPAPASFLRRAPAAPRVPAEAPLPGRPPPRPPALPRSSWRDVTERELNAVAYERLPPDAGLITPIATTDEAPDPVVAAQLERVRVGLPDWAPGRVADPEQRVRNLLTVAAVPDVLQMSELERFLPVLVYERLRADYPKDMLRRLLYRVAMRPNDGSDAAGHQLAALGLPDADAPPRTVRTRIMLYALKLLGRQTGAIVQQ